MQDAQHQGEGGTVSYGGDNMCTFASDPMPAGGSTGTPEASMWVHLPTPAQITLLIGVSWLLLAL
jgi:hypothetical protein